MKFTAAILAATVGAASAADFAPIVDNGNYGDLLGAVVATGNDQVISDNAPVTIFGPKDSAFAAAQELVASLSDEEVSAVLLNHVIVGAAVSSADVVAAGCINADTAGGLRLGIKFDPDTSSVTVNGVSVTEFDVTGDYGALHGIESILLEGVNDFVRCPFPDVLSPIDDKGIYGTLLGAVMDTGAIDDIVANVPVTIFGPKDSAFEAIAEVVATLSPEDLKATLFNHVILGNVTAQNVIDEGCIEAVTVGGLKLGINFDADTSTVTVNGISVSDFDVTGDYGVLHGIDSVLVAGTQGDFVPCPAFEADFTPIVNKEIYSTLVDAVVQTGNDKVISANAPVTIFGPKDSAFAEIQSVVEGLSTEQLSGVLLDHVVVGAAVDASAVIENGCTDLETAGGLKIAVRYDSTTQTVDVNGIAVNDFNIIGDYGIMHGMDGVLLEGASEYVPCPAAPIFEQVSKTGEYNTLLSFLSDPSLEAALQAFEPLTIFGPNDAAFAAIAEALAGLDDAAVQTTLGNHVVAGAYAAEDVKKAGCVVLPTVLGGSIRAMYVEGGHDHDDGGLRKLAGHASKKESYIMINEAKVILADIADDTNIFHGIDTVLLSTETFECPTEAPTEAPPVASPTNAPSADEESEKKDEDESSASFTGFSVALTAIVALSAFVF